VNLKGVSNIFGLFIGLAVVSVIAAKPKFISDTFSGSTGLLRAAVSPVTGK
jgi:hypothetical protein